MQKLIHDVITGEKTLVDLSAEEIAENLAQAEKEKLDQEALIEAINADNAAKAIALDKLTALGLTTDDLKALGL